jgi:hypothetical protein
MPTGPVNLAQARPASSSATQTKVAAGSRNTRQPIEREAIANLSRVFTQLDGAIGRGKSAVRHHGNSQDTLPAGLMSSLRGTSAGNVG